MHTPRSWPLLALLAALAGCAKQGGDKFATISEPQQDRYAAAFVQGFFSLCGRFDSWEIAARARSFGFERTLGGFGAPVSTSDRDARIYLREVAASRQVLVWSPSTGECQLLGNDPDPEAVARALEAVERRIEGEGMIAIEPIAVDASAPGSRALLGFRMRLRALSPTPPRLVLLMVAEPSAEERTVVLLAKSERGAATTPPPEPGPQKTPSN